MSDTPYVPVLPFRQSFAEAYRSLHPGVRRGMTPLWTLPPYPEATPPEWEKGNRRISRLLGKAHATHPGWLDASATEKKHLPLLSELMTSLVRCGPLRPVVSPGDDPGYLDTALAAARRSDRCLGIRVRVPGEWREATAETVHRLLKRAERQSGAALLLDASTVLPNRPDAGKQVLRALEDLLPLAVWRSVAVLAGGYPEPSGVVGEDGWAEEPRTDRSMWRDLVLTAGDRLPPLSYGDYAVHPAARVLAPHRKREGGPATGFLAYTTGNSFVISRVWRGSGKGGGREEATREAVRRLVDLPGFRGAAAGAGETWLRDVARGHDATGTPVGTGNHGPWLRVGTTQHLTRVVCDPDG